MNWQLRDLKRIRIPLVAVLLAFLLAGGLVGLANWIRNTAINRHNGLSAAADDAEVRAATAVTDRANLATYQAELDHLKKNGVLGEEQRLAWVEAFAAQIQKGNPAAIHLQIEPRRLLEDPPNTPEPLENVRFFASKLELESKLLHEGDLLRMLAEISALPGASIIRQCNLKRSDGSATARPYLLEMKCHGELITLDTPPSTPETPPQ
ncbi:hypothetical protein [Chitinimonas sp. BJB300]|uniref:hypothetical protein n=1 Tax=Chitinimonas sp. BJB300 TaxID=1559339 RepID=UPI000C10EEBD|nr:hypothetical protein [Chitinimonas sp. BJB300]PHV11072.1 hypothetical protein CSQ89_12865 [Chitinimonas sp. BJB300]TSJ91521.1 hypothetical protein FG002_004420 [Chitinimonas sp. BJB300]